MSLNVIEPPVTCKVAVNFQYINSRWPIRNVEIYQDPGMHQRAIIRVKPPVKDILPIKDTPVTIEYGQLVYDLQTYYGHVDHIEHVADGEVELWTVGASAPLKNETLQVWRNVSASYIATRIAIKYQMHIEVDPHNELLTVVQTGQTDFKFLTDLAARIGYKFFVIGTTMYFINPLLPLREATSTVQKFYVTPEVFFPKIGELIPGSSSIPESTSYALDAETGQIIGAKNQYEKYLAFGESKLYTPLVKKYSINTGSSSVKEVLSKLNAEVSASIHWVTAEANLGIGSARLQPCSVISVQGPVADKFQGLWLVNSIVQTLTPGHTNWNYSAKVSLMRDQIYSTTVLPRSGWTRATGMIETRWVNGRWISEQVGA